MAGCVNFDAMPRSILNVTTVKIASHGRRRNLRHGAPVLRRATACLWASSRESAVGVATFMAAVYR
jgi:hypothetical protein